MRRSHPALLLFFLLALAVRPSPAAGYVNGNLAVPANGGGCYPTGISPGLFDMLTLINPEWAPVVDGSSVDSAPVLISGRVDAMHGDLSGDFPSTHLRADVNFDVEPDPDSLQYVGLHNDGLAMHVEWEGGVYPAWAWAGPGDRMYALGRWIFDCGHPGTDPGHCSTSLPKTCANDADCAPPLCPDCTTGETCEGQDYRYSTEIHPPYATVAIRSGRGGFVSDEPGAKPILVTRADVFAGPEGGGAGDRCILTHQPSDLDLLSEQCWPLDEPIAQLNQRDFAFSVPLPKHPPHARVRWRMTPRETPGGVPAAWSVRRNFDDPADRKLEVTIHLTQPVAGVLPTGFAGTLEAGWEGDPTPLTHVRVTAGSIVVRNPLKPKTPTVPRTCSASDTPCATTADCPSGEQCFGAGPVNGWRGQISVNGEWAEFKHLGQVSTPETIGERIVFDQWLPADGKVVIHTEGRSDECIDAMYGRSLGTGLAELGLSKGIACLATEARNLGTIDTTFAGPDFGAGSSGSTAHRVQTVNGAAGTCSGSGELCAVAEDCPTGESCVAGFAPMVLRFRVQRIADAPTG